MDDNADAAESLAELVRLFGHEVEVAYDAPADDTGSSTHLGADAAGHGMGTEPAPAR